MVDSHPNPRLLRETEAAPILGIEVATLRRWRWAGKGPSFRKIGAAVRYDPADLDAFIAAAKRTSTSDPGPTRPAA
jgi:predicted DNA-binding transcriptional regulator AlpA